MTQHIRSLDDLLEALNELLVQIDDEKQIETECYADCDDPNCPYIH